jgi:type IV pilus assembly protein PilA
MSHLRQRMIREESGFTLVELLVVMVILALLAAIAIPAFFNQRDKARDADAKTSVRTAETAMETYATDNDGSYDNADAAALVSIESTLSDAALTATPNAQGDGYTVSVDSTTGNHFDIRRYGAVGRGPAGSPRKVHWADLWDRRQGRLSPGQRLGLAALARSTLVPEGQCFAQACGLPRRPFPRGHMRDRRVTLGDPPWRARDERGFAVPTVLFMLLAVFAVVSVGVVASIQTQGGIVRDQNSKAGLPESESGVSQALLAYNSDRITPNGSPCLVPNGTVLPDGTIQPDPNATIGAQATTDGVWCRGVRDSGGAFTYWVKPGAGTLEIVSVGNVNGVTRRVDVVAQASSGQQVFLNAAVKTQNGIVLDSNAEIHSSSATGGDISLASNAKQCGSSSVGVGHHITPPDTTGYFSDEGCTSGASASSAVQQNLTLPPVNQGDAATNNDNCRITAAITGAQACPTHDYRDLVSGHADKVDWNPTTRQLEIRSGGASEGSTSLHLTGHTYSFCKLTLNSNTALYIDAPAGEKVNIYFDSPEACDKPPGTLPVDSSSHPELGTTQLRLDSNSRITASTGDPASIAIFFVGSSARRTNALLSSNTQAGIPQPCVQNFIVYAPQTALEMNSNSSFCGAMAGQMLHMDSNAHVETGNASKQFQLPWTPPHYVKSRFIECPAASASPPNAGC